MSQPESPGTSKSTAAVHRDDTTEEDAAPVQPDRSRDRGDVPDKQIYRWKDDGGALPPGR